MGNCLAASKEKTTRLVAAKTTLENNTSLEYNDEIVSPHQFPGEFDAEILVKLPVKSLIRFKAVCKTWNMLINSPVFINEYLRNNYHQLGGYSLYPREYNEGKIFPVDISFIVGACNGIICLATFDHIKRLLLFNPFTKEFSFVPPGLSPFGIYGFCYLPKTQQYQIISFSHRTGFRHVDIVIMTLGKTTSLREVNGVALPGFLNKPRTATSGTSMFWLGKDHGDCFKEIVICYDVIEEKFSKIDVLPYYEWVSRSLRVLKDSVVMFVSSAKKATYFDIWMLVDDVSKDRSWVKYRTVGPLKTCLIMNPIDVCWDNRWILCGKVDVKHNNEYRSEDLFYYDLETDQVKDYEVTDPPIREFVNYEWSLVSVSSLVPCIDTNYSS